MNIQKPGKLKKLEQIVKNFSQNKKGAKCLLYTALVLKGVGYVVGYGLGGFEASNSNYKKALSYFALSCIPSMAADFLLAGAGISYLFSRKQKNLNDAERKDKKADAAYIKDISELERKARYN
jgi:hypothetical protein